jgi:hypothetical protein
MRSQPHAGVDSGSAARIALYLCHGDRPGGDPLRHCRSAGRTAAHLARLGCRGRCSRRHSPVRILLFRVAATGWRRAPVLPRATLQGFWAAGLAARSLDSPSGCRRHAERAGQRTEPDLFGRLLKQFGGAPGVSCRRG